MRPAMIWLLAWKELREALRNRWFLLYAIAFVALALGLSYLALAGAGMVGFAGFGRTAASLINLVLLIVPLMALTVGAQSLAGEHERGTLSYLMAQPIDRAEIFVGKFAGLALSLLAALALGFGISGLVMALSGSGPADPTAYLRLAWLSWLLGLAMLSVGLLVSAFNRRASVAAGIALFLWLVFVFLGDLGMMGTVMVMRVPADALFWIALTNPLQVFKMAAILDIRATLDVLGPAGIYAIQRHGDWLALLFPVILVAWVVAPSLIAYGRFAVRGDL